MLYPFGTPMPIQPVPPPPPVVVQRGKVKELIPWVYDYDFKFESVESVVVDVKQDFMEQIRCVIYTKAKFEETTPTITIQSGYRFYETVAPIFIPIKCSFTESSMPLSFNVSLNFIETLPFPFVISTKTEFTEVCPEIKIKVLSEIQNVKRLMRFLFGKSPTKKAKSKKEELLKLLDEL